MRLNRLNLTRYGRFRDAQIVFPIPKGDNVDLTVIYGPNEAGKSTAFSAYLELLFGMKARDHPYEFKFKRSDLLVGAELDLPNRGRVILHRNSKKNLSLLDEQGRPVEETVLAAALQGLGRDDYVERFSLNDEGLRKGGARIASAQGDLGQLLHAGVSGLTGMALTLDQMSISADRFYKRAGRGTDLKVAKDRLTEIGKQLRAEGLTPKRESRLAEKVNNTKAVLDVAETERANASTREVARKSAQTWYDLSEKIRLIDDELEQLPYGPNLPRGAVEAVARLVTTIKAQSSRMSEADENIAALAKIIADNPANKAVEEMATELAKLEQLIIDGAPFMARGTTAVSDLGKRIKERGELCKEIDQCLLELSTPDIPAAALVLTPHEIDGLARAAQAVLTAQNSVEAADNTVKLAKVQRGAMPPQPQNLSQLQAAWDKWQSVADISGQQNKVVAEAAQLLTAVVGLPKDWALLVDAGLPARETLSDVARLMPIIAAKMELAEADHDKCDSAHRLAQSNRQADEAAPSAIDLAMTAKVRRYRDEKWAAHREIMSAQTAGEFESAMQDDDDAQASFAVGSEARGRLALARREEASALVLRKKAQEWRDELIKKHSNLVKQSSEHAKTLGLGQDSSPAAFIERYNALVQAAHTAAKLKNAEAELKVLNDNRLTRGEELRTAATHLGIECAESELPNYVRAALTLQDSVRQTWEQWNRANDAITDLEKKAVHTASEKETADNALAALTAALPLAGRTAEDVNIALPYLRNLQRLQNELEKLSGRIEKLESAVKTLKASAAKIITIDRDIGDPVADPLIVIEKARISVASARSADIRRDEAQSRHVRETAIRKTAVTAVDEAQTELSNWFKAQGAADLTPTMRVELLNKRDELRATRNIHDTARNAAREGVKLALFEDELALLPDSSRSTEVQQLLDDALHNRDMARDAHREATRIYQEAFDAADLSELVTEQATIREELRTGARRAAVLRLGVLAAKGALRRLASERRTTMLCDVEEAFVSITSPAWKSVDVWSQTEGEKLVGIQPDGTPVPVEMMSTGTMGQLYFSLRAAGYRSFARDFGPLPMILDDIMETFDNKRAKAALQLCSDIGNIGQAIIFTHHAHLVDLARETITDVNIVNMPS